MLYLYRQLRFSPIPCGILAQIKLPLRTYAKTRLYYKYYLEGKKTTTTQFQTFSHPSSGGVCHPSMKIK